MIRWAEAFAVALRAMWGRVRDRFDWRELPEAEIFEPTDAASIERRLEAWEPRAGRGRMRIDTTTASHRRKESLMRFIPTKLHAPLDYIVGVVLIAAPWIFQFSEHAAPTVVSIVLGIGLIAYSLFTNYELGVWKVAPMAVHNLIDIVAGTLLAASPWIFGFADDSASVWLPFVVIGVAAIFLGLTTTQAGGYSYRKPGSTPTAAAR